VTKTSGTLPPGAVAYQSVGPDEARRLVDEQGAFVLDVRTPEEFADLGHIPGATLLPVDLVAAGPALLPTDGRPVLVCCEHGVRSRQAVSFLARAGVANVWDLAGGMCRWGGPREHAAAAIAGPSSWLLESADLLPRGGRVLDVACGRGRHALLLAAAGFPVVAVDRRPAVIDALNHLAERLDLPLRAEVLDLETGTADLGTEAYDVVLVFRYLHRPLFPAIVRALRPGGLLLYETFTVEQARRGRPREPEFLLEPGELSTRIAPLEVLRAREGEYEGQMISAVAARAALPVDPRGRLD
jgi:rhodanese-related sulfurtransferase